MIDFEEVKVKTLVVEVQGLGQRATAGLYLGVLKSSVPPIRCLSALQAAWVLIGMFLEGTGGLQRSRRSYTATHGKNCHYIHQMSIAERGTKTIQDLHLA